MASGTIRPGAQAAPTATPLLPPGPSLPAPLQGLLFAGRFERFSDAVHARFGATATLRFPGVPTTVLTCDRAVARELFTADPLSARHGNDALRPLVGDRSVMVLDPAPHLARRKLLLPPFHGQRLAGYGELMTRLVGQELASWPSQRRVIVHRRAQKLTLEVILQGVLGVSDPGTRNRLGQVFEAMLRPSVMLRLSLSGLAGAWGHTVARPYWKLRKQLDAILYAHVRESRSDPGLEQREDVLALLIQARDETGSGLNDDELRDELATLIAAGYETTATAISWGVDLLAHNAAVNTRAREAVRDGDDAYLDALVKEILRIRPPVPVTAARHPVTPLRMGPWTVQPHDLILINAWAIHHDATLYPDPHEFRPERFLEAAPESYTLIPFGGGAHRCLGAALAELEIRIFLKALLTRREITPVSRRPESSRRRSTTLSPRHGTRIAAQLAA